MKEIKNKIESEDLLILNKKIWSLLNLFINFNIMMLNYK